MSQIFDRLERLFKSYVNEDIFSSDESSSYTNGFDDDMKNAWEEMEEFLKTGKTTERTYSSDYSSSSSSSYKKQRTPNSSLDQDYKNLEVAPGSSFEEVRRGYKKMILKYHPDRFTDNPKKQADATEIMKKINASYQNIKQYEKSL